MQRSNDRQPGIQSIEVGGRVLDVLVDATGPVPLSQLAEGAGIAPSNARRYLISFMRMGLVAQEPISGHYEFGPLAFRIGVAWLNRVNIFRRGAPALTDLRDQIDETVYLSIWSDTGPTIVTIEESSHPIKLNAQIGATLPLLTTSTGQIFAGYLAWNVVEPLIQAELVKLPPDILAEILDTAKDVPAMLQLVRQRGYSDLASIRQRGIHAITAPVFDFKQRLAGAITAITQQRSIDTPRREFLRAAVVNQAKSLTRELAAAVGPADLDLSRRAAS
jgi:DNA-binding IclR family transcriptional regulator